MRMGAAFQRGDAVRQPGTSREMVVEGYDDDGRVLCALWKGIAKVTFTFLEKDLEKIPFPNRVSNEDGQEASG